MTLVSFAFAKFTPTELQIMKLKTIDLLSVYQEGLVIVKNQKTFSYRLNVAAPPIQYANLITQLSLLG